MNDFFDFPIYEIYIPEIDMESINSFEKRKVLILIDKSQYNEKMESFLTKVLNSINLDIKEDCNIFPIDKEHKLEFYRLISLFGCENILSFGINEEQFSSQALLKTRAWNKFESFSILLFDNLETVEKSQELKKILWENIKIIKK